VERNADHKRDLLRGLTVFRFVLYVVRGGSGLRYMPIVPTTVYIYIIYVVSLYYIWYTYLPIWYRELDAHARTHARLGAAEELGMQFFIRPWWRVLMIIIIIII